MENLSMNTFEMFTNHVKEAVKNQLGDDYQIELHKVNKNNGIVLTGISILSPNSSCNISPTIYLNNYYEAYRDEKISISFIIEDIISTYNKNKIDKKFDVSSFLNFEKIKNKIIYKLINAEKNSELLKDVPHIPYLDLAIVFEVLISEEMETGENATILIHHNHTKLWNTSLEEIYNIAMKNTPNLLQYEVKNLKNLICDMLYTGDSVDEINIQDNVDDIIPMYVLSNKNKIHGASAILYPNLLADFAKAVNNNLIIIPSSIHECILLPVNNTDEIEHIRMMIKEVNNTQLNAEELLSYNPYYFDKETGKLNIA